MEAKAKKRERAANFNSFEIKQLISLAEKHKNAIENKKTDAFSNNVKEAAWGKIAHSFNASGISASHRSSKTLKLKYEGLKKNTKKKSSQQRQELYRTGGGPSNAPEFDLIDKKVLGMCSNISGLPSHFDCDNVEDVIQLVNPGVKEAGLEENIKQDLDQPLDQTLDTDEGSPTEKGNHWMERISTGITWERWNPKGLKSSISKVLQEKATKGSVTKNIDELSSARLELVHLQAEIARQQHQFVEEEHMLKMEHMKNDEKRKAEMHSLLMNKLF